MTFRKGQRVEIIDGISAGDFQEKLNRKLEELDIRGIKYDMQLSPQTGFLAYIVYENETRIVETIKDEFEIRGEKHTCIECPYFVRPTDGRIKYTRCGAGQGICKRDSACCEQFYEWLYHGNIELVEVVNFEKQAS